MNKDILFIHTPKFNNYYKPISEYIFILFLPVGLLGLADLLNRNGYKTRIIHLGVEFIKYKKIDLNEIIIENKPDIIGLDLHWHHQSYDVIEFAKKIKIIDHNVKILLGGFTASYFAEEIMKNFDCIDFIIKGEAEIPVIELIKQTKSGKEYNTIPNLVYRENNEIKSNPIGYIADEAMLDSLNFTNFELLKDYKTYIKLMKLWVYIKGFSIKTQDKLFKRPTCYPIALGRGCLNDCYYCGGSNKSHATINNRKHVTLRSVNSIIESIKDIEKYGFDVAMLNYDPLPSLEAENIYLPLFEKIKQLNTSLRFYIERWQLPSKEFIKKFKDCLNNDSIIEFTLNSQNEELRKKNNIFFFSNKELEKCLWELEKNEIKTQLYFATGLPFESKQDLIELKRYINKLKKMFKNLTIRISIIEIEPCSDLTLNYEKYNVKPLLVNFNDYYKHHANKNISHYKS